MRNVKITFTVPASQAGEILFSLAESKAQIESIEAIDTRASAPSKTRGSSPATPFSRSKIQLLASLQRAPGGVSLTGLKEQWIANGGRSQTFLKVLRAVANISLDKDSVTSKVPSQNSESLS